MPFKAGLDLGGLANSFMQGYKLQMMQDELEERKKVNQQNYELNKLLKQEQALKIRQQTNALEEAEKINRNWRGMTEKQTIPGATLATELTEFGGADQPSNYTMPSTVGPSKVASMFSNNPAFGQLVESLGPKEGMSAIKDYALEQAKWGRGFTNENAVQAYRYYTPESIEAYKNKTGPLVPLEKPDKFVDWGHGQKRDTVTGEIISVPTKPDKPAVVIQQSQFTDPETGKPLVFDKSTQTYKVANVEGGAVAPRLVNPSSTEREKTAALDTIEMQLKKINDAYIKNPSFVGLISGRVGKATQLLGSEEAAFRRNVDDIKDVLLRARSGAQINEKEYARLATLVPSYNDSTAQFEGKMASFLDSLETIKKTREESQRKGGVYIRTSPSSSGTPKNIKAFWR